MISAGFEDFYCVPENSVMKIDDSMSKGQAVLY